MLVLVCGFAYGNQAQTNKEAYALGVEGIFKVDNGQYKEGIALLKKARNLEPQEYDYSFEIGKAYMKSGEVKKAEKYLFPLQYHANVQADLYVLLSGCYEQLEETKKNPDLTNKKAMDVLRYGIQKLPESGVLYFELAKKNLALENPKDALATLELGVLSSPNFAENYFWAAKLMQAAGNHLWAWVYAECFYNMTDDLELKRSAALLVSGSSSRIFSDKWKADPNKFDENLRFTISERCKEEKPNDAVTRQLIIRRCLINQLSENKSPLSPILARMKLLEAKGWLDANVQGIFEQSDKQKFVEWVVENGARFDEYRKWSYWKPMHITTPLDRLGNWHLNNET